MPLHSVRSTAHPHEPPVPSADRDPYATPVARRELPRVLPERPSPPRVVHDLVRDELLLDGNARQNLATFCTTWVEEEVGDLLDDARTKNLVDKDEYPQTARIESRCVAMLADLWHAPDGVGTSTAGSSEAALLAGLALRARWRRHHARPVVGVPDAVRLNLVTGPVQVCWEKFARYFDVELRQVPLRDDRLTAHPEDLAAACDDATIGVVSTLGVTFTGAFEPVAETCAALDALAAAGGPDVPVHVDAASGGFVAPFLDPDLVWDFRLPRVSSINASGHKYGLAPLGVGWVVFARPELLAEELVFHVDYLGGDVPTYGLNFSRPGGPVIAQYHEFVRLGREGYRAVQGACRETARWIGEQVGAVPELEVLQDGSSGLPAVCHRLTGDPGFTLHDVTERLRLRGWQVASYPLPAGREDTIVQRILVRHGLSRSMAGLLVDDLRDAFAHLRATGGAGDQHPGFHH